MNAEQFEKVKETAARIEKSADYAKLIVQDAQRRINHTPSLLEKLCHRLGIRTRNSASK